jgi:hypothetical protein
LYYSANAAADANKAEEKLVAGDQAFNADHHANGGEQANDDPQQLDGLFLWRRGYFNFTLRLFYGCGHRISILLASGPWIEDATVYRSALMNLPA